MATGIAPLLVVGDGYIRANSAHFVSIIQDGVDLERGTMNPVEAIATVKDNTLQVDEDGESNSGSSSEEILCRHCLRTATNGIKCQGICVADSDY
ncbi:hypothetical protein NDA01_26945 [Trichocoleus desertorum AS-A10]|uniref:hypothetical protein n=1 Tax=Trichocoleus desertorum TaxID=1481672 RepID=UPI00329A09BF